jgi:hypothetical protein
VRSGVAAARSVGTPPAGAGPVAEVSAVTAQTGPAPASALDVVPTPDDGVRRSTTRPWDESERPVGPAPEPGQTYPHKATARQLVAVHDGLRGELAQIRDLVDQVRAGTVDPGVARSAINTMTMRQNNWTLGAYCESYCRLVTTHHTAEDQGLIPALRSADPRLKPVVDRLEYEHTVIHDVLDQVDQALVALVSAPDGMDQLTAAMDLLSDTLLSHLSYEERELIEPLARLGY